MYAAAGCKVQASHGQGRHHDCSTLPPALQPGQQKQKMLAKAQHPQADVHRRTEHGSQDGQPRKHPDNDPRNASAADTAAPAAAAGAIAARQNRVQAVNDKPRQKRLRKSRASARAGMQCDSTHAVIRSHLVRTQRGWQLYFC